MKKPLFFALFLSLTIACFSQPISQWRGVNRDGIYNETHLLTSWPENGPTQLWLNEILGNGYGSPVIANNKLFVNGETDSISQVFAFDLKGQLLWKAANGKEFMGSGYSANFPGSRSTPTVVGDLVYACSGMGRVACFEANTGKERWGIDMMQKFSGIMNAFGVSESMLIDGDKLFCYPGGSQQNVVALNRFTGETIWTSKALGDTISYCSPMLIKLPSRNILVNFTTRYIFGLDAGTGELLWSQKQEKVQYKQQCNTALYNNGYIYYITGDGNGAVKLQLSTDGSSIKEVWRNEAIKNYIYGFVKLGDYLYSGDKAQKLKCISAATGLVTDSLRIAKGAVIAADNMLYLYSDDGMMNLIKPNTGKMELVSKFKIDKGSKEHFAHPVIDKGVLYVRHGKALMAYDIKNK